MDARQISGIWFVSEESIREYKEKTALNRKGDALGKSKKTLSNTKDHSWDALIFGQEEDETKRQLTSERKISIFKVKESVQKTEISPVRNELALPPLEKSKVLFTPTSFQKTTAVKPWMNGVELAKREATKTTPVKVRGFTEASRARTGILSFFVKMAFFFLFLGVLWTGGLFLLSKEQKESLVSTTSFEEKGTQGIFDLVFKGSRVVVINPSSRGDLALLKSFASSSPEY